MSRRISINPVRSLRLILENVLKTGVVKELVSRPVSKNVNSVKNNDPSDINPLP